MQATQHYPYWSRSFIFKIAAASDSVTALAITIGQAPSSSPYTSHSATPAVNALYMPSEMPRTTLA